MYLLFLLALMAAGKTFVYSATSPYMGREKLLDLVPAILDVTESV
jgi:hypothetical protein